MRIKVILQNYNTTHTKYQELLSAMLKEQRGERMDEEFIRNRITELRLKKGVSEYQMSMELGQNRSYIQAISSGRSMPSMKQFLNICEYFEITPLQFFDAQENNPQLIKKALDGMRKMSDDDLIRGQYRPPCPIGRCRTRCPGGICGRFSLWCRPPAGR